MNKLICNDVCKSFRIGNDNLNVLNNINLTIEKNDTVAITGVSGAGKSSLLSLVPRIYDPKSIIIRIYKSCMFNNIPIFVRRFENHFVFVDLLNI